MIAVKSWPRPGDIGLNDVLQGMLSRGVRLWLDDGQLRYQAPKGALGLSDIDVLRAHREELVTLLRAESQVSACRHPVSEPAPLAYSQRAHWNLHRLGERFAVRQIASATRMQGRLNIAALRAAVAAMVRRHHALRTNVVMRSGVPMQIVGDAPSNPLEIRNLTGIAESECERCVLSCIEHQILQPIDVARDSLFGACLLRLPAEEHVLILAMEHMIADMFSLSLLQRELFTAYVKAVRSEPLTLPDVPVQITDYAVSQHRCQAVQLRQHGEYWKEHWDSCPRVRFPASGPVISGRTGWGTARLRIDRRLRDQVSEWGRRRGGTLVMSIFAAYAAAVLRWCDVSDVVIGFQSDGRVSADLEYTVGYISSPLYLRMRSGGGASLCDLLRMAMVEYARAQEHADCSYFEAQTPRPAFTLNTAFNWIPRGSASWMAQGGHVDLTEIEGSGDAITCTAVPFEHPMLRVLERDSEPFILLYDTNDGVEIRLHFALDRFTQDSMERFAQTFLDFVRILSHDHEQGLATRASASIS